MTPTTAPTFPVQSADGFALQAWAISQLATGDDHTSDYGQEDAA